MKDIVPLQPCDLCPVYNITVFLRKYISSALLTQSNHQRLRLVRQISSVVGPVMIVFVDEGYFECPDYSGDDESRFGEEGPKSHELCQLGQ